MKKQQQKAPKNSKTKIELKIKSKNVTNNFILTPRTVSPRDQISKTDRFTEQCKTDRLRYDETPRHARQSKAGSMRRVITDSNRFTLKKRFQDDETGTHTPLVKRISVTHQGFHKKKSCHSLVGSEKTKTRKKTASKSGSADLNTIMFQRVLGIIIKDYKQGRLKERELEQTLLELYDRQKKKSTAKKKRKEQGHQTFSNQFLRSVHQGSKKRKMSEEEVEQRVLERQGFVNKIIIKGITTSMFLKEDQSVSQLREVETKGYRHQPSLNIHTSNSVKEINEDIRRIGRQFQQLGDSSLFTYQDQMATRIQRAWRRHCTKRLLRNITLCQSEGNAFNIVDDEFTDEQGYQVQQNNGSPMSSPSQRRQDSHRHQVSQLEPQDDERYANLTKLIINSMMEKKVSKDDCLKSILSFLNVPEEDIPIAAEVIEEEDEDEQERPFSEDRRHEGQGNSEELAESRVKILPQMIREQNFDQALSNEMNSFTNKYSSKDAVDNSDFYRANSIIEEASELDRSLTFVHSQASETFKMVNIQNIEEGLRGREESLVVKKQKEVEELTERFFGGKLTKDQYLAEKTQVDKWFKHQLKQLKKVKNSLLKSCNDAQKMLDSEVNKLNTQKSQKMMKCLSDKYLKRGSWSVKKEEGKHKKREKRMRKIKCEDDESSFDELRAAHLGFKFDDEAGESDKDHEDRPSQFMIFNKKDESLDDDDDDERTELRELDASPKMSRSFKESDDINEYKYEQIEKIIEEDDDGLDDGLIPLQNMVHVQSDRFEPSVEEADIEDHEISLINKLVNENKQKFKYLCNEDKEDIFEFLFLDLVLEMFTEGLEGQSRILRSAQVYINKAKRLRKIPKGIKTNIAASKDYLSRLSKYVVNLSSGLKNLSFPMGPSAVEMLRYMRDEIVDAEDEEAVSSTLVLPIEVFEKVSKLPELELKLERYYDDDEKEFNRLSFLKTALNINNKSLFDCLNQMLDHERPYGVWGKPFPWKKALSLDKQWTKVDEERKLRKCLDKTVESSSYLCGILADKEDSLFGSHRVSEQYIMQIREDRLSKMLANELLESEQRWIFYDDQETEILMEVSSFLTKKLIKEAVLEMVSLGMKF